MEAGLTTEQPDVKHINARIRIQQNRITNLKGFMAASYPIHDSARNLLQNKRDDILRVAAMHGARNVRVFGSVARGEADERSDIDLLVDMEEGRTLFDMGGLLMDLRELLHRDVDIVTEKGLKPRMRERVLREAKPL